MKISGTVQAFNSCTSRPDVSQCVVVQISMDNMSINKPSTSMTNVVMRSSMHPCQGNWVAIRRAVAYYARAAHAFSVETKCRHCS